MKILVIPSWYPSRLRPVEGIFIHEQAIALHESNHQVSTLAPPIRSISRENLRNRGDKAILFGVDRESIQGLPIIRSYFPIWPPRKLTVSWNARLREYVWMQAFEQYVSEFDLPDIIHAHSSYPGGLFAMKIRNRFGIPVILTEHWSGFLNENYRDLPSSMIKMILRSVDRVLAVSPALAQSLTSISSDMEIEVVGNMVNTSFFSFPAQPLEFDEFVFASIGNLIPLKRMDYLIIAFTNSFRGEAIKLRIGGDGKDREALKQLVQDLKMSSQIELLGSLSRNEVRDVIWSSDAVVSTSSIETFGLTLAEALSCGKPVIATRSGGPEYFIHEGNGILVPVEDTDALARAMEEMLVKSTQYNPLKLREECIERFGKETYINNLNRIYRDVANQAQHEG